MKYDANGNTLRDPLTPWEEPCKHCQGGLIPQVGDDPAWCIECEGTGVRLTDEGHNLLTFLRAHKSWFIEKGDSKRAQ